MFSGAEGSLSSIWTVILLVVEASHPPSFLEISDLGWPNSDLTLVQSGLEGIEGNLGNLEKKGLIWNILCIILASVKLCSVW